MSATIHTSNEHAEALPNVKGAIRSKQRTMH